MDIRIFVVTLCVTNFLSIVLVSNLILTAWNSSSNNNIDLSKVKNVVFPEFKLFPQKKRRNLVQQEGCCSCVAPDADLTFVCPPLKEVLPTFTSSLIPPVRYEPNSINLTSFDTALLSSKVEFFKSKDDVMCTLVEISSSENNEQYLKPLIRSYNGYNWEISSTTTPYVSIDCTSSSIDTSISVGKRNRNRSRNSCIVELPNLQNSNSYYQLTSFPTPPYSNKDKIARFMEQATFGPKMSDINSIFNQIFDDNNIYDNYENKDSALELSFANWIKGQQFLTEMTSHREYYRSRLNTRHDEVSPLGNLMHPCDENARYRRYAFTYLDVNAILTISSSNDNSQRKILSVDNYIRTIVDAPIASANSRRVEFEDGSYEICKKVENKVGAKFMLQHPNHGCISVTFGNNRKDGNPMVQLPGNQDDIVLELPLLTLEDDEISFVNSRYSQGDLIITRNGGLKDSECLTNPQLTAKISPKVVFGVYRGEYYIHDPHIEILENTIESPILDGGASLVSLNYEDNNEGEDFSLCANVAPSFVNEDNCILSTNACAAGSGEDGYYEEVDIPELLIPLNHTTIRTIYEFSGGGEAFDTQYLYSMEGLRIEDDYSVPSPCEGGATSRWIPIIDDTGCQVSTLQSTTVSLFQSLISSALQTNKNDYVLEIPLPREISCDSADEEYSGFLIQDNQGNCWKNVHPDYRDVYDLTSWVENHPGNSINRNPIMEFAEWGNSTFLFPWWHEMDRWQQEKRKFPKIGTFGGTVNYFSLDKTLRENPEFTVKLGINPDVINSINVSTLLDENADNNDDNSEFTVVCGSPNEIQNNPTLGGSSYFGARISDSGNYELYDQKRTIWTQIALESKDQLRQRIAWALAQILVVSTSEIVRADTFTEIFVGYYDIFVRNAFGNYRDILKEVSYSPLMAEMLTYYSSQSTAYLYERRGVIEYADENYAREIMQLFTMGLFRLNLDGTTTQQTETSSTSQSVRNEDDNESDETAASGAVYTNDDIVEYARVWTGFWRQQKRGNIEQGPNRLDPMVINIRWRDQFPKMGLNRKYIGDGYPLCADMPSKHFLLKGAKYVLRGSNPLPELQSDPMEWIDHPDVQRFIVHPQDNIINNKSLFAKLCAADNNDDGNCRYPSTVILDETVLCTGDECDVDTLRTVQVGDSNIYYEYIRQPCVYQAFYENAKIAARFAIRRNIMCADPRTEVAQSPCCPRSNSIQQQPWNDKYWGERSKFQTAVSRCGGKRNLCSRQQKPSTCGNNDSPSTNSGARCASKESRYWTDQGCTLRVKIDDTRNVAIVHGGVDTAARFFEARVHEDESKTFFRVDWSDINVLDDILENCGGNGSTCSKSSDGMCICDVSVVETKVFSDVDSPPEIEILDKLHIGAVDPSSLVDSDIGTYVSEKRSEGVTIHMKDGQLREDTIFEVLDSFTGVTHFRKNMQSTVFVAGNNLSFRNPVHFVSLEDREVRDAHHETDAALDHYFYHPNTPPFLSIRFAQRFGISNPSPRYVKAMAEAFRTGYYNYSNGDADISFGAGKYGDLEALIACVLLDREARNVALDADPSHGSLKEPLLKVIGLMRSLELEMRDENDLVAFNSDISDLIGQMAHEIPDVFSFFRPEYSSPGPVAQASLVAPEAQVTAGPKITSLLNGLMSLVKYGLTSCWGGFGTQRGMCRQATPSTSEGSLSLVPSSFEDLYTVMTAGRLSISKNREIIEDVVSKVTIPGLGLIRAQQLIVNTPEFHSMGSVIRRDGQPRPEPKSPPPASKPYKAMVYVLLAGGVDSFNMLVPHTCRKTNQNGQTVLDQYNAVRSTVAMSNSERSRIIDTTSFNEQPCDQFAIHQELEIVERLYKEGDLAFFANTGVINKPSTKENYKKVTKTQLFAHNEMQEEAQKIDPFSKEIATGVLGRMCDILVEKGYNSKSISIDDSSISTSSANADIFPLIVSSKGITEFHPKPNSEDFNPLPYIKEMNSATELQSSLLGETWSEEMVRSIKDNKDLLEVLANVELSQPSTNSKVSRKMNAVTSMILTHEERNVDHDIIYVKLTGWDMHRSMKESLSLNFQELNEALTSFYEELKEQGLWNDVTLQIVSDFGRTLTPNSSDGTDHGWGGNYFMMGGSVKGGQIFGQYPEDISESGPYNVGRGRIKPTMSWESILNSVLQWMDIESKEELDYCLPNRFQTGSQLLTKDDVFVN